MDGDNEVGVLTCDLCGGDMPETEIQLTTEHEMACAECAQRHDVEIEEDED